MNSPAPTRSGASLQQFEQLDAQLRAWAHQYAAEEHAFPALIAAEELQRAEYPQAFPHLLMAPAVAADPGQPLAAPNLELTRWMLSPAVCYHAYASLAGETLAQGRIFSARGGCFRHEEAAALVPGRRQVEFQMRELVFVGEPKWLETQLAGMQGELQAMATSCGIAGAAWQPASDPFFLPSARGKAHLQRLLGTKFELCLRDELAIASINRHGAFFGERFGIRLADTAPAHSACIAFGLDRWAAQLP